MNVCIRCMICLCESVASPTKMTQTNRQVWNTSMNRERNEIKVKNKNKKYWISMCVTRRWHWKQHWQLAMLFDFRRISSIPCVEYLNSTRVRLFFHCRFVFHLFLCWCFIIILFVVVSLFQYSFLGIFRYFFFVNIPTLRIDRWTYANLKNVHKQQ